MSPSDKEVVMNRVVLSAVVIIALALAPSAWSKGKRTETHLTIDQVPAAVKVPTCSS